MFDHEKHVGMFVVKNVSDHSIIVPALGNLIIEQGESVDLLSESTPPASGIAEFHLAVRMSTALPGCGLCELIDSGALVIEYAQAPEPYLG